MIKYVAKGKSKWFPVEDDPIELKKLEESGDHKFTTVLSVSEISETDDENVDYSTFKYKGPLYFDIDYPDDIAQAIDSTQELVENLQNHGVLDHYIQVFCTGSKGFHILVHQKVFCAGRALAYLPAIYKEMALKFVVKGLDFRVYTARKGRMWRVPNVQRKNGKYKVQITLEELFELTVEKHDQYISAPRKVVYFPDSIVPSTQMKRLFQDCSRSRIRKEKSLLNMKGLGTEHFKVLEKIPECIEQIRVWEGLKSSAHFNQIILQTVTYIKAAELEEPEAKKLVEDIAKNSTSHRFPSQNDRKNEILSKLNYVNQSNYKFDCSYVRSILDVNPCHGCKLEHACKDVTEGSSEGTLGIVVSKEGYFRGDQKISTFTFKPINRYLSSEGLGREVTVGVEVEIMVDGDSKGVVKLSEEAFLSKSELMKQTKGFDQAVFIGCDTDVQKIKHNLFEIKDKSELGDIMETYTAGIMETRKGSETLVYVEPNYSIDQYKTVDTHLLNANLTISPEISEIDLPREKDLEYIKNVMLKLFDINEKHVVAQILGWVCACHLRTHLSSGKEGRREFPLLFLTGNAGTGKTQTAGLILNLHCIDYLIKDSAPSLGSITEWALIDTCSSTTTIPRILDEFNKGKMGLRRYSRCSEILKMAWGSQTINRGTISKGASTIKTRTGARTVIIPISSPLVVLGEQQPTEPAVQQRACIIPLKRTGRQGREKQFKYCVNNTRALEQVGKAMIYTALKKPLSYAIKLKDKYEEIMPDSFEPRAKVSYQTLLMGLDFFNDTLESIGIDLTEEVEDLKQSIVTHLDIEGDSIGLQKAETEMDRVIGALAIMALVASNDRSSYSAGMEAGMTYLRTEEYLYLDIPICHSLYATDCPRQGRICVIDSPAMFIRMLREEAYCVDAEIPCDEDAHFAAGRKVAKLSMKGMLEKGLEVEYFSRHSVLNATQPKPFTLEDDK